MIRGRIFRHLTFDINHAGVIIRMVMPDQTYAVRAFPSTPEFLVSVNAVGDTYVDVMDFHLNRQRIPAPLWWRMQPRFIRSNPLGTMDWQIRERLCREAGFKV